MSLVRFLSSRFRVSLDETAAGGTMSPPRLAALAMLCGTLVINGWVVAGLVGLSSSSGNARVALGDIPVPDADIVGAAWPDPHAMMPPATPPVRIAGASTPVPVQSDVAAPAPAVELTGT